MKSYILITKQTCTDAPVHVRESELQTGLQNQGRKLFKQKDLYKASVLLVRPHMPKHKRVEEVWSIKRKCNKEACDRLIKKWEYVQNRFYTSSEDFNTFLPGIDELAWGLGISNVDVEPIARCYWGMCERELDKFVAGHEPVDK